MSTLFFYLMGGITTLLEISLSLVYDVLYIHGVVPRIDYFCCSLLCNRLLTNDYCTKSFPIFTATPATGNPCLVQTQPRPTTHPLEQLHQPPPTFTRDQLTALIQQQDPLNKLRWEDDVSRPAIPTQPNPAHNLDDGPVNAPDSNTQQQ